MSNQTDVHTIELYELIELLRSDGEYAFLDVREAVPVQRGGSPLVAVNIPASRVEVDILRVVPRRSTRIVLTDGGGDDEHAADRTATVLRAGGYDDVLVLRGGTEAWAAAGYELFAGSHALGQSFGEYIEEQYRTPHIAAGELVERLERGDDIVLLDSRPISEFESHSLPGARCAPGAELVRRAELAVSSPTTLVVVNCAGRTRGILGAQALISTGFANPVVALENGTQGWRLAGATLRHGDHALLPEPAARPAASAAELAQRFGVELTTVDDVTEWQRDPSRTVYLFDVRTPEEYAAGHFTGARSVPSWEAVPWVFRHAATRNARLVLVDGEDAGRAVITAWWLQHLGWGSVSVLAGWPTVQTTTAENPPERFAALDVATVDAHEAATLIATGSAVVIDVGSSLLFGQRRVPGAWFAVRSLLVDALDALPAGSPIIVTSEDGAVAEYAAADLAIATTVPVVALRGGTDAWVAAGQPVDSGPGEYLTGTADWPGHAWFLEGEAQLAGFREYLAWEIALADQVRRDVTSPFVVPVAAAVGS